MDGEKLQLHALLLKQLLILDIFTMLLVCDLELAIRSDLSRITALILKPKDGKSTTPLEKEPEFGGLWEDCGAEERSLSYHQPKRDLPLDTKVTELRCTEEEALFSEKMPRTTPEDSEQKEWEEMLFPLNQLTIQPTILLIPDS